MKRNYQQPCFVVADVEIEAGFATSWGAGTPGGEIGYEDYNGEL